MKIIVFLLITLSLNIVYAQEASVFAGGNFSGLEGNVSFSFGQVNNDYLQGSNGNINAGVQQSYSIIEIPSGISEKSDVVFNVYPNPTLDILEIESSNKNKELKYQLIDSNGKLIIQKKLSSEKEQISLKEKPDGVYLLTIFNTEKEIKTFRIIKNKS